MNEWGVFLTLGSILGFMATMYTMFYKPTHELKIEIVKLTTELISMRNDNENQDRRIENNESRISNHEIRLVKIENTQYIKDRYE